MKITEIDTYGMPLHTWTAESYDVHPTHLVLRNARELERNGDEPRASVGTRTMLALLVPLTATSTFGIELEPGEMA